ncbi:pirin family protein [Bacteroides sp.]|uniref:pirin family protein n=1 Tax=Bacteroides sp. TaxID=29523 RepID=UPI001B5DF13C|nr:pirin family protein [Bacteroides sp.]MBP6066004.1 pirin family protein [Bacteroides sp.]MBP6068430.1 pirin family protein [Bacteroides sp.]MBP6936695.1 pirin family protein [Bacteroides sp.]MBP8622585.1 pirin family protein [Bacteroides sp.]MBP9506995.1 pirin family protein [Bacteroides sp.]
MKKRNIELTTAAPKAHWVGNGFRVHNFIPGIRHLTMERMNPFILLDYNSKHYFQPSDSPRGVGVHPHRGFETVTIAYKGKVQHHDSNGGGGIIGEGDVQWMTASSGILHKEYHEKEWSRQGGDFQMVQLWVNLPAKDKMADPKYQAITNSMMGKHILPQNMGEIEIIAGEYKGVKGPAFTFTPMHLYNARLRSGAEVSFSFPEEFNTALLVIEGEINVNDDARVPADHFVLMANDGEEFSLQATEDAVVLVLSGLPIREPIAAQGPFVMNTRGELKQAFDDFNNGKFGYLEE